MARYSYFSGGGSGISPLPPNFAQLATAGPAAIAQGMKEASQAIGDALKEKQKAAKLKKKEATSAVNLIKAHLANESQLASLKGIDIDDLDNMSSDDQIALGGQVAAERQAQITQSSLDTAEQNRLSAVAAQNEKADTNRMINEIMRNPDAMQAILPMAGDANMAQVLQARLSQAAGDRAQGTYGMAVGADARDAEAHARAGEKHAREIAALDAAAAGPKAGTTFTDPSVPGFVGMHTGTGAVTTVRGGDRQVPESALDAARRVKIETETGLIKQIYGDPSTVDEQRLNLSASDKDRVKSLKADLQIAEDNLAMIEKLGNDAPFVNYDGDLINEDKSKRQQSDAETWTWGEMSSSAAKTMEERKVRDLKRQIAEITGQAIAEELEEEDENDRMGLYR
tara:strand:- start:13069 stop:14259 length:1191 start_codon:yes stop_codon:yes gene_type:complete